MACPIELTKVRLQVRVSKFKAAAVYIMSFPVIKMVKNLFVDNATGPFMVIRQIMKTEGSHGLFRGLSAMLWR